MEGAGPLSSSQPPDSWGAGVSHRFLRSKTLNTAHWRIYRPTTGALLLLTALQLCDQVRLCFGSRSTWRGSSGVSLGLRRLRGWLGWAEWPECVPAWVQACIQGACTQTPGQTPDKGTPATAHTA